MKDDYIVVWSGRDSLLPDREERHDTRIAAMPSFDLDEDAAIERSKPKRKYNRTGNHKGKFSRTNPAAAHYKPTVRKVSND